MTTTRTPANPTDFPTDPRGLEPIGPPSCQTLTDGDTQPLRIGPVAARIGSDTVRMLAYNGSVPGPTMRIAQHSQISVPVHNDGDDEATVHWHGLRLDNAYDGVPYETQQPSRSAATTPTSCASPTPACTGTTRTSGRITGWRWGSTARSW